MEKRRLGNILECIQGYLFHTVRRITQLSSELTGQVSVCRLTFSIQMHHYTSITDEYIKICRTVNRVCTASSLTEFYNSRLMKSQFCLLCLFFFWTIHYVTEITTF